MKTLRLCALVLFLLVLSSLGERDLPPLEGAAAAPTTINFDDRPAGRRIVDQYAGVRFPDGAFIRSALQLEYPTQSMPNFLERDCHPEFDTAPLRIQFTTGQGWVGVYVGNPYNYEQPVIMRAYDAMTGGRLVGTAEARLGPRAGITTLLQICRAVNRDIRRVEIWLGGDSGTGCEVIDDLSFDPDPLGTLGGATTVNFDDRAESTRISTQYAGLEFPDRPWIQRAASWGTTTISPPNALEPYSYALEFHPDPLRVNFTRPQAWVRVHVGAMSGRVFLRAFTSAGRTPAAVVHADLPNRAPITTPLEICRFVERDITRVEIQDGDERGRGGVQFERIDDFQFAGTRVAPPPSDTQAPRVFIDSPRTGDFFFPRGGTANIEIQGRITENRGLERVVLIHEQVDGRERREDATMLRLVSGTAPNFTFRFSISLFPGRNRIRLEATDTAGNRATNPEREIIVTLAPPMEIIIDAPRPTAPGLPTIVFRETQIELRGRVRKQFGTLSPERLRMRIRAPEIPESDYEIPVETVSGSAPEFMFSTRAYFSRSNAVVTIYEITIQAIAEDGATAQNSMRLLYVRPDIRIQIERITQGAGTEDGRAGLLVADRKTVLQYRIFLDYTGVSDVWGLPLDSSLVRLSENDAFLRLSASRGGRELGRISFDMPIALTSRWSNVLSIPLPMEWTRHDRDPLRLTVELGLSSEGRYMDCCLGNNRDSIDISFAPPKVLRVLPVKIRLRDAEPISDEQIAPLFRGIERMFPVSQLEILPPATLNSSVSSGDFRRDWGGTMRHVLGEVGDSFTCYRGIRDVGSFFGFIGAWLSDCSWTTYVVGLLPPSLGCAGGIAWLNSPVSVSSGVSPRTVAHEVAHCLGRKHAGNSHGEAGGGGFDERFPYIGGGIGVSGYDTTAMREIPAFGPYPSRWSPLRDPCRVPEHPPDRAHDFLSYGPEPSWISPYTWSALFDHPFRGGMRGASPRSSASAVTLQSDSGVYLHISGHFTEEGTVELRPFYTGQLPAGASVIAGEGRYSVVLERADGRVLFTGRFDPLEIHADQPGLRPPRAFSAIVPFPAGTARIVIRDGDRVLATRTVSTHAPRVTILSPRAGDVWGAEGTYTVMWTGSDADGDMVHYVARYTPDGGRTWFALGTWSTETRVEVDASGLTGSSEALIEVVATDGVNTTRVLSAPFRVSAKGPFVAIYAPPDDFIFRPDQLIRLQGMANDREDGELPENALEWTSDRDGPLGRGRNVELRRLSPGVHKITLTATDRDGQKGQASIIVRVAEQRTLTAVSGLSGSVDNAGGVDVKSLTVGNGPRIGQPPRERVVRAFLSFDLTGLPQDVEILEAHLALEQREIRGNPYLNNRLGGVVVDLVDYGASLGGDDFGASVIENVGTLSEDGLAGVKQLDVTKVIRWAREKGLSRVQFRLRFSRETDEDGFTDTAVFDLAPTTQLLRLQVVAGGGSRSTASER
ncbi:MAG: hypothetical protein NZ746_03130 [Blastocatellia bacterium]|nr:hypothetical protein [Blastocatellia bacterium]